MICTAGWRHTVADGRNKLAGGDTSQGDTSQGAGNLKSPYL